MKKTNNLYKIWIIAAFILFFFLNASISTAIPVPLGVDGVIYDLDGITQVRSGIDFSVENLNNGQIITGKTGHGSSGRYSVSLTGNTADSVIIKAWNKYNSVNATLEISGVMRNVNLFLNMTYPPYAPNITSTPLDSALEDAIYYYQIEAFDENEEDFISYKLIDSPLGMVIDQETGLVTWIPSNENVGLNSVSIQTSDGLFLTNQTFEINVHNTNDEVVINSTPITYAKSGQDYSYQILAFDEDGDFLNYYLDRHPEGMTISSSGLIKWKAKGKDKGLNLVVVNVTDGIFTANQQFHIDVESEPEPKTAVKASSGGGGGAGGGGAPASVVSKFEKEKKSLVAVKLPVPGAEVRVDELTTRPKDAKKLERRVYRYLIIENVKQIRINNTESAEINFTVDKNWLLQQQINPSDIIMTRYHNNTWQDLATYNLSSDNETIQYVAKTPGFSYFAISVRQGIEFSKFTIPQISKVESPFRISGVIYKFGKFLQAKEGTGVFLENTRTGEKINAATGFGPNTGAYYLLLYGKAGDEIKLTVGEAKNEYSFELEEIEGMNFMINAKGTSFSRTDGDFLTEILSNGVLMVCILAMIIGLVLIRLSKTKFNKY